ncbi:hypothetical protein C7437_101518 [Psychrobacillus insolitus]|uniref:Uncharacterized protein n=2 Tax=Psychrobacillus insolitus TaxID=1461 RepID=A0A2W7MK79_9BACI|nr:hypothetical protein C7437_101518 [Psychrobacillus insolitus]
MFFIFIAVYGTPILAIIFCLNLISIIKKVKAEENFSINTVWLTVSFAIMVWSIAVAGLWE